MYQHPDTIKLIHNSMVEDEMQRHRSNHHRREPQDRSPGAKPGVSIRTITGGMLIAVGSWIAPKPRPIVLSVAKNEKAT